MGNRLASRNTAVPFANMAKLTTVAARSTATKWPWHYNRTRLLRSTSGIRLDDARLSGTTTRNDNFHKELRSGIGKSTKNVFGFQPGWFYELAKNNVNFISQGHLAGFGFGENGTDETRRTINKVALNMSATVLTTIGLLLSFATFYSVSAATKPQHETSPEDEDSHYSQESSERMEGDEFYFGDGTAFRDSEFKYVWRPSNPKNPADCIAAHEAARREAEKKANSLGKLLGKLPYVIAVLQDLHGNAIGGHSIKGEDDKERLGRKMSENIRKALDKIPQENQGVGHGFCAEIACVHNMEVVRRHQQNRSEADKMFTGTRFTVAYERTKEEKKKRGHQKYEKPKKACKTCEKISKEFHVDDFEHVVRSVPRYIPIFLFWCWDCIDKRLDWDSLTLSDIHSHLYDIFMAMFQYKWK